MNEPRMLKRWAAQWKVAGDEMERMKALELARLGDKKVREMIQQLFASPFKGTIGKGRWRTSGLVEQQKRFSRCRV